MSVFTGGLTISGTGSQSYTGVGFQGNDLQLTVGGKSGSSTVTQFCIGNADGTRQNYVASFGDGTGHKSTRSNSFCILHYERVSGTITEVLKASFTSFDADGFTLNVTTANANYSVNATVRN